MDFCRVGKFVKYIFGLLDLSRVTLGKFWQVQSNLSLLTSLIWTPLYYGQFVWSQKCQKSCIPYLYNMDTSVMITGSVPLVCVLKRFECILFGWLDLTKDFGGGGGHSKQSEDLCKWLRSFVNKLQPNLFCGFFGAQKFSMGFLGGYLLDQRFFWVFIFAPIWSYQSLKIQSTPSGRSLTSQSIYEIVANGARTDPLAIQGYAKGCLFFSLTWNIFSICFRVIQVRMFKI